ncbi:Solute carrier family 35 member E1-like protein [Aphelenchoides avenae]|nr:Solute carrier family 35 member E1-like protein [Aphelenchus avenae]
MEDENSRNTSHSDDFEDDEGLEDEEDTLDEEEALDRDLDEADELAMLQDDAEMSIEELRRKYGLADDGEGSDGVSSSTAAASKTQYYESYARSERTVVSSSSDAAGSSCSVSVRSEVVASSSGLENLIEPSEEVLDEEQDADYIPPDQYKKDVRVGSEYQVQVPDTTQESAAQRGIIHNEDAARGPQLWQPPASLSASQLDKFLLECGTVPTVPASLQNGPSYDEPDSSTGSSQKENGHVYKRRAEPDSTTLNAHAMAAQRRTNVSNPPDDENALYAKSTSDCMCFSKMESSSACFAVKIAVIIALLYASSAGQNVINKIALQHFPYPLTIALVTFVNNVIYCVPLARIMGVKPVELGLKQIVLRVGPIAAGRTFGVVASYFGLWKVSVAYMQTLKSTSPLFTVLIARLMLREQQSWWVYASLTPVVAGVGIASATEHRFNTFGFAMALVSTATFALISVFAKKVFKDTGIHPTTLLSYNSRLAVTILLPLWLATDARRMWMSHHNRMTSDSDRPVDLHFAGLMAVSGFLGFMGSICTFILIDDLSALSYAVTNTARRVSVIAFSLMVLHSQVTPLNVGGMLMAVLGLFLYNRASKCTKSPKTAQVAPTAEPCMAPVEAEKNTSLPTSMSAHSLLDLPGDVSFLPQGPHFDKHERAMSFAMPV